MWCSFRERMFVASTTLRREPASGARNPCRPGSVGTTLRLRGRSLGTQFAYSSHEVEAETRRSTRPFQVALGEWAEASCPMAIATETQQLRMLERLRGAGNQPVTLDQQRNRIWRFGTG